MKKLFKNGIVFSFSLLSLLLGSCNKWLSLEPENGIIKENFWNTKEQLRAAILGCYGSLMDNPTSGGYPLAQLFFYWGELRADMIQPSLATTSEELQVRELAMGPSNSLVNWAPVYETINFSNTVIAHAPEVKKVDNTLSNQELNSVIAEAKGLRALMYFYLVRSFGEVPLRLEPTDSDKDLKSLSKSSQEEVLDQIITDLEDAKEDITLDYGDQDENKGRLNRYSIDAILADVYLWTEQYDLCIKECDEIINSGKFGLLQASSAWYTTLYRIGNSNESIFEIQFNESKPNPFYNLFGASNKHFLAANRVMDIVFGTPDANNPEEVGLGGDIRGDGASLRADDGTIWKFIGINSEEMASANDCISHWPVYRYAEVLLMKAEALAQSGDGQEALDLINVIRKRAHAVSSTNEDPDIESIPEMTKYVLEERSREFMFEGKRWYDILRYVKRNDFENIDFLMDMISQLVPADMVHTSQAKLRDHNSLYFPIFQNEIETNKNLVQNPFYN